MVQPYYQKRGAARSPKKATRRTDPHDVAVCC